MNAEPLRFTVTTGELRAAVHALDALELGHGNVMLTWRDASPWLEVDVAITPERAESFPPADLADYGLVRLALWRRTRAVYRLDEHGAVEDDPIPGCEGR